MVLILKLLSIIMIVYGCLLMLKPEIFKKVIDYVSIGNRVYVATGIKVLVGALMMLASSYCKVSWFVLFIGAIVVLSSLAFFFFKRKAIDDLLGKLKDLSNKNIYVFGILALILGVLFILSI